MLSVITTISFIIVGVLVALLAVLYTTYRITKGLVGSARHTGTKIKRKFKI